MSDSSNKAGYVYILTNPSFKEDWVKIGRSSRPVDVRSKELDNTAVPLPFEIYATMKTVKYVEAEKLIHRYIERFTNLRIRDNREFFNVQPEVALDIFRDVADVLGDAVIEEVHKNNIFGNEDHPKSNRKTPKRDEQRIWLIPSNSKFFDLDSCFKKYGCVYWRQHVNFQKGDIGYIYSAYPNSAILYKVAIDGNDLSGVAELERQGEFYSNPGDRANAIAYNRHALFTLLDTTVSNRLNLPHLLEHGMKAAPQGAMNLSHTDCAELLKYIEENF